MRVRLVEVCEYANFTKYGGANIMNMFHKVLVEKLPFVMPHLFVVVTFELEALEHDTDHVVHIALVNPDAETKTLMRQEPTLPPTAQMGAQLTRIYDFSRQRFHQYGNHEVRIEVDGQLEGTAKLAIDPLNPQE